MSKEQDLRSVWEDLKKEGELLKIEGELLKREGEQFKKCEWKDAELQREWDQLKHDVDAELLTVNAVLHGLSSTSYGTMIAANMGIIERPSVFTKPTGSDVLSLLEEVALLKKPIVDEFGLSFWEYLVHIA
jgi:hypothetical protein